jgi:hypothetical protein
MAPVESAGVAAVEPVDSVAELLVVEPREQVVVRRHEAKAKACEEVRRRELRQDLNARVVVAVVAEDVLFCDRSRCDVVVAGVRRAHVPSMPEQV